MAISHTETNDVSKVTTYIKLAIRHLSQYIEKLPVKAPKDTDDVENHISYIAKLIENAFIGIAKRDLQKIKEFVIDGKEGADLIDFLLAKKNREDIFTTKQSPSYLKARTAAFLIYELYKKLLVVSESQKNLEISYPFAFPQLNEANFDKLIKWAEDTKKYFLHKGLISESHEETVVSVTNKKAQIHHEPRANKEFDSLWSDKNSTKNNVIHLFEDYTPYSWNILSRKHEVQTAKEMVGELRKSLYSTPIEVCLYLKVVETSHKGKVKSHSRPV